MSKKFKKEKNIVEEWAIVVKDAAESGYSQDYESEMKEYFQKIIGLCEGILVTLDVADSWDKED